MIAIFCVCNSNIFEKNATQFIYLHIFLSQKKNYFHFSNVIVVQRQRIPLSIALLFDELIRTSYRAGELEFDQYLTPIFSPLISLSVSPRTRKTRTCNVRILEFKSPRRKVRSLWYSHSILFLLISLLVSPFPLLVLVLLLNFRRYITRETGSGQFLHGYRTRTASSPYKIRPSH